MTNERKYGLPFEFIDREGRTIRTTKEGPVQVGKAYLFLDCDASEIEIERELTQPESNLEISVKKTTQWMTEEENQGLLRFANENEIYPIFPSKLSHLKSTAKPTKLRDLKYVVEAKCPKVIDEDTAAELGYYANFVYYRFGDDKPFNAAIIYKGDDGEYIFRE